jgi:hypothetical protein
MTKTRVRRRTIGANKPTPGGLLVIQQAMIINAIVLAVVLEADIGPHRKITKFRVLRPIVTAAVIIPLYLKGLSTHGTGLVLELALAASGILLGLAATGLMTVYRSPRTDKPVSRAGWGYGGLWVLVIGARSAFSYGSVHWFGPQLSHWMTHQAVTSNALTAALIFMAVGMLLTRTIGMAIRATHLAPNLPTSSPAPVSIR